MINIFRKIRKNLLLSNKTTSYLLYAIGEIVLVMIGILLALQVNNWNENRKQKNELKGVLQSISNDMIIDTTLASGIIKFYVENSKNSLKIINKEITMENYKDCLPCIGLVTTYQPFNVQRNGFERLKNITENSNLENDTLISNILNVYSQFLPLIDSSNERMEDEIIGNFNDFKGYDWFVDLFQSKFTPELIEYFVLSEDYRKRVTSHNILAAKNHLAVTKQYTNNAKYILNEINKRLVSD